MYTNATVGWIYTHFKNGCVEKSSSYMYSLFQQAYKPRYSEVGGRFITANIGLSLELSQTSSDYDNVAFSNTIYHC